MFVNMWHDFDKKTISESKFYGVIEIPKGSKNKYELDKKLGMLRLDRVLYTSTHYPANYGFIPCTLAQDEDPLDILVLCQEPIDPGIVVECYPIGVLKMVDSNAIDEKIIAIPFGDPSYIGYQDISDLPKHIFDEIKHFFEVYKYLENKITVVEQILGRSEAEKSIRKSIEYYGEVYGTESSKKYQAY